MMVRRWMVDGRTMDGPPVAGADALKANHPLHSLKISKDANFEYLIIMHLNTRTCENATVSKSNFYWNLSFSICPLLTREHHDVKEKKDSK
jgi:hypothetical protein